MKVKITVVHLSHRTLWQRGASIALVVMFIVNQLYWLLQPHLITYQNSGLHARANVLLHSGFAFGATVFVITLGMFLQKQRKSPSVIIKLWLNLLAVGLLTALVCNWQLPGGNTQAIYDVLLPITRNAAPLISGVMLGYLISRGLDQLSVNQRQLGLLTIGVMLLVPSLFKPDLLGWQTPNPLLYALLLTLGWHANYYQFEVKHTLKWTIISCCCLGIFEFLIPSLVGGQSQLWYAGVNSIVIIIPALITSKLISQLIGINYNLTIAATLITIAQSPTLAAVFPQTINDEGHGSLQTMIVTLITALIILGCSWIWSNVVKLHGPQAVSQWADDLARQAVPQQLQTVKQLAVHYWPQELIIVWSYFLSALMMSLTDKPFAGADGGAQVPTIIFDIEHWQGMILLTAVIIVCVWMITWFVVRRYWVAFGLINLTVAVISLASKMKIDSRQEPILPADLSAVSAGNELMKLADKKLLIIGAVIAGCLIVLIAFLEWKRKVAVKPSLLMTALSVICMGLIVSSASSWNRTNGAAHRLVGALGDDPQFINQLDGAKRNGPIIQFMNNLDIEIMKKPAGYSEQAMQDVQQRYHERSLQINQTRTNQLRDQTIIFNLSESFANPDRVPGVKLKSSPIPKIQKMMHGTTSGLMMSSGYGGGTANMEWMTLTGFNLSSLLPTLSVPYTQLVPNQRHPQTIVNHFDFSAGIHPYVATYYNRISNYQKFGFNKFEYFGSKYPIKHQKKIDRAIEQSDETSYANLLDQINSRNSGQFINLMTMQNHMPYDLNDYNLISKFNAKSVSEGTDPKMLNNYATRLHYTDDAVDHFISEIDKMNKPVTIVFYGDHLPGLYGNDMNVDNVKLHETDYFIYSNKYAREHGMGQAKLATGPTKFTSPQNFIPMVAAQTNSKVDWYYALLTDVWQQLPVMSLNQSDTAGKNRTLFTNQQGEQVSFKSMTPQQKQLYRDYQLVQYDLTAGKHYLQDDFHAVN